MTLPRLNLPNRITVARLLVSATLFLVLVLLEDGVIDLRFGGWTAFVLFVVAAATDWLDGYVARRRGEVTVFGRIMDPFTDKVVVCGTFVILAAMDHTRVLLPAWMVVVILAREFFVNAIRGYAESRGISFAAEMPGKVKMFLQCLAIGAILLLLAVGDPRRMTPGWLHLLTLLLVWAALVATVLSGWFYARKALRELGGGAF